jgi:hemerythrin
MEQDVLEYHQHVRDGVWVADEQETITQLVMQLLRPWVLDHVLKEDKRMEHDLRKMPANFE